MKGIVNILNNAARNHGWKYGIYLAKVMRSQPEGKGNADRIWSRPEQFTGVRSVAIEPIVISSGAILGCHCHWIRAMQRY